MFETFAILMICQEASGLSDVVPTCPGSYNLTLGAIQAPSCVRSSENVGAVHRSCQPRLQRALWRFGTAAVHGDCPVRQLDHERRCYVIIRSAAVAFL